MLKTLFICPVEEQLSDLGYIHNLELDVNFCFTSVKELNRNHETMFHKHPSVVLEEPATYHSAL